jgi:hypothetical protein
MVKVPLLRKHGGQMIDNDPNPFDGCQIDEIFALTFDLEGPSELRALLTEADLDRDELTIAASKLKAAGLLEAANLVAGAAARAADPNAREIAAILADPNPDNQRALLAQAYRQGHVTIEDLEAAGIDDDDTLDYIERAKASGNPVDDPKQFNNPYR